MKAQRWILALGAVLMLLWGGIHWFQSGTQTQEGRVPAQVAGNSGKAPSHSDSKARSLGSPLATGADSGVSSSVVPAQKSSSSQQWEQFTQRFGAHLVPRFSKQGVLVSIQGAPLPSPLDRSTRALQGFDPSDPKEVIQRSQEIQNALASLMGVDPEFPLMASEPHCGPMSAQVSFRQTYRGIPFYPDGSVRVDLGKHGEILSVESDYVLRPRILGEPQIQESVAWTSAWRASHAQESVTNATRMEPQGVSQVISMINATEGHIAYRIFIEGREMMVDGISGEVLWSKDLRQF
ncbi:MAG: hypothetical protein ACO3A2_04980 [Bdellovibrionia bacterium]